MKWFHKFPKISVLALLVVTLFSATGMSFTNSDASIFVAEQGSYDDTDPAIVYSGGWVQINYPGPYKNTLHSTTTSGSSVNLTFSGSSVSVLFTKYANRGNARISIDGMEMATMNAYSNVVEWQQRWDSPVLSSGIHTITVTYIGSQPYFDVDAFIVNGTSTATPISSNTLPPTAGPSMTSTTLPGSISTAIMEALNEGTYDDTDPAIVYSGGWVQINYPGPYKNTLHSTMTSGSNVSLTFSGSSVSVLFTKYANRGNARISIDGMEMATMNAYSNAVEWQQRWDSPVLSSGIHTITVTYIGSQPYFDVDAFIVNGTSTATPISSNTLPPIAGPSMTSTTQPGSISTAIMEALNEGTYDDTDPAIVYSGGWVQINYPGPYKNTLHSTMTSGSSVSLTFSGSSVSVLFTKYANRGNARISIDGMEMATVNAFSNAVEWQQRWDSPVLSSGIHTITVTYIGNQPYFDVDAFIVTNNPEASPTEISQLPPTNTAVPTSTSQPIIPTMAPTSTSQPLPTMAPLPTSTSSPEPTISPNQVIDAPTAEPTTEPTAVPSEEPTAEPTPIVVDTSSVLKMGWFYNAPYPENENIVADNFDSFYLSNDGLSYRNYLRDQGNDSPIIFYMMFNGIFDMGSCEAEPNVSQAAYLAGDFCTISEQHPDWFLLDVSGNRIHDDYDYGDGKYLYLMDPGSDGWREFWLDRTKRLIEEQGWDGVFMDNMDGGLSRYQRINQVPAKYPDDNSMQEAYNGFAAYVYSSYFQPNGKRLIANITEFNWRDTGWMRYLDNLDGMMDEGFGVDWESGYFSREHWEFQLNNLESLQNNGKEILYISQGASDDQARQEFAFATYMLVANGVSSFRYTQAGSYIQPWIYDNYALVLGSPLGTRYQDGDNWVRDFANGKVIVNPDSHSAIFQMNQ
ncbi:MAG: putative glycoside hydrolase [Anaerolineaceae bacterium]